jgi:uncharacterized protein YpmB
MDKGKRLMKIFLAVLLIFSMSQSVFSDTIDCTDETKPFYISWFSSDSAKCQNSSLADTQEIIPDDPMVVDENSPQIMRQDAQTEKSVDTNEDLENLQDVGSDDEVALLNNEESDSRLIVFEDQISTLAEDIALLKADKGLTDKPVEEIARDLFDLRTEIQRIDEIQDQNIAAEKDKRMLEVNGLKDELSSLQIVIKNTKRNLNESNSALEQGLIKKIDDVSGQLKRLIDETQEAHTNNAVALQTEISELSNKQLALIIGLSVMVLAFLIALLIWRKHATKHMSELKQQYEDIHLQLSSELNEVDQHVVALCEELSSKIIGVTEGSRGEELDHSLVIKVADELMRIEKNLSRMDQKTKGLKQLKASVGRIKDNVLAHGYEIVDMLGMKFNEGMKVQANFIEDESLDEGTEIISKIIKPQINFKGEMIQSAQVEVSQGV